jgi:hypothetical protein
MLFSVNESILKPVDKLMLMFENKELGKNISVITDNPLSENNFTDVLSIIKAISMLALLGKMSSSMSLCKSFFK